MSHTLPAIDTATALDTLLKSNNIHRNLQSSVLVEHAIRRDEQHLADNGVGAFTGKFIGRAANAGFTVKGGVAADAVRSGDINEPFGIAEFDVFLAHNAQDKSIVEPIAKLLRRRHLKVWFDKWILPPGRPFQEEIEKALPCVKAIAVFVGTGGLGRWERMEMRAAIAYFVEKERPVIPVLLPGAPSHAQLPPLLREFSAVQFSGYGDQEALLELLWGITGKRPLNKTKRRE